MSLPNIFKRSKKVLVVEDDVKLRTALKEQFENTKGYSVLEAGDAHEVLSVMGAEKPDALVLDLILPLKDGISLLEELRASGHTIPVLILSNLLGSDSLRADAERLDATFYNKSSVSLADIVSEVTKLLA